MRKQKQLALGKTLCHVHQKVFLGRIIKILGIRTRPEGVLPNPTRPEQYFGGPDPDEVIFS